MAACAFGSDRDAATALHTESRPILEELCLAWQGTAPSDLSDFSHRELIKLIVNRARRMAELGMTPGAAAAYVPTLAAAVSKDQATSEWTVGRFFMGLLAVAMEAYVSVHDDKIVADCQTMLAEHTPVVLLRGGVVLCLLMGNPEPERIARVLERLDQAAFRSNARAVVVDVSHLSVDAALLPSVLAAVEGAKMLGIRCIFCGIDSRWQKAPEQLPVGGELAASLEEALGRLAPNSFWRRLLGL